MKKLKKYYMTVIIVYKMIFDEEGLENNFYLSSNFQRDSLQKLKYQSKQKIIPTIILLMIMQMFNNCFMLLSLGQIQKMNLTFSSHMKIYPNLNSKILIKFKPNQNINLLKEYAQKSLNFPKNHLKNSFNLNNNSLNNKKIMNHKSLKIKMLELSQINLEKKLNKY